MMPETVFGYAIAFLAIYLSAALALGIYLWSSFTPETRRNEWKRNSLFKILYSTAVYPAIIGAAFLTQLLLSILPNNKNDEG